PEAPFRCRLTTGRAPAIGNGPTTVAIAVPGASLADISGQRLDESRNTQAVVPGCSSTCDPRTWSRAEQTLDIDCHFCRERLDRLTGGPNSQPFHEFIERALSAALASETHA